MRRKIEWILMVALFLFSLGCVIYASVMQCVLSYEKYGVIFSEGNVFIPHESAWWYLGGLGIIPCLIWCEIEKREKNERGEMQEEKSRSKSLTERSNFVSAS